MKYNTIGATSNLGCEGIKKSSFKIYADMDLSNKEVSSNAAEISSIRSELQTVQKALHQQTRRCRQLVSEYTKRLQQKEQQYQSEKALRDDQLAKVLRALIMFEARLRQEQKFISHQLKEKDYVITRQSNEIKKLITNQYCKNCNQYYSPSPNPSCESSSEYVVTDYQSSNFESLDSSSDIYATVSEKSFSVSDNKINEDNSSVTSNSSVSSNKKNKDSCGRKSRIHRKSVGTYFEVLKIRNDHNASPCSTHDDNTSNDYDNLDSLPTETGKGNDSSSTTTECDNTVINKPVNNNSDSTQTDKSKITDSILVFEGGETNDNWYASASDAEDEEQRDVYRNNPVLECMNQILLQNIDDINSPPKTPNIERKTLKNNNKKVKFSDEDEQVKHPLTKENVQKDYYETPIQKVPNFYETPQSIYSNDYEQILSKCSDFSQDGSDPQQNPSAQNKPHNHFYMDLVDHSPKKIDEVTAKKEKIPRTPPALPPKPANLVLKYKNSNIGTLKTDLKTSHQPPSDVAESEPDYCSISELNLPDSTNKSNSFKRISVVAEINPPNSQDVITKIEKAAKINNNQNVGDYDPVGVSQNDIKDDKVDTGELIVVKKCVEKLNVQLAKQTIIKSEVASPSSKKATTLNDSSSEIPKLPQVSEIIIPDDESSEETSDKEDNRISHDNYVKNNSQILKMKGSNGSVNNGVITNNNKNPSNARRPIVVGTSVSNLITGFNNQQLISELKKPKRVPMFSSFESLQNLDKQHVPRSNSSIEKRSPGHSTFDLSQNFEEFKLDDCEIEEYEVPDEVEEIEQGAILSTDEIVPSLNPNTIELLKQHVETQKTSPSPKQNEPTYEHFLECTGLSSKSILTPTRLLSNHKSMLKPKDVKFRSSKLRASTTLLQRHSTSNGTIKYWSEPYI